MGVPVTVMPAPLVAASGLVLWYESGQLRDYAVFAAGAALTGAWFLHHHFWFLQARFEAHVLLASQDQSNAPCAVQHTILRRADRGDDVFFLSALALHVSAPLLFKGCR